MFVFPPQRPEPFEFVLIEECSPDLVIVLAEQWSPSRHTAGSATQLRNYSLHADLLTSKIWFRDRDDHVPGGVVRVVGDVVRGVDGAGRHPGAMEGIEENAVVEFRCPLGG